MKLFRAIARLILGFTFLFAGFVKLIDPVGGGLIVSEYFKIVGIENLTVIPMLFGAFLAGAEMLIGISLLLGLRMKFACKSALVFISFFTVLTLFLALFDPITDCGCFGEVIKLTNWQTFNKNIVLLIIAIFLYFERANFIPIAPKNWELGFVGVYAVMIVFISVYSYRHLPVIDFLPYRVATDVKEEIRNLKNPEEPAFETTLYYSKNGKTESFKLDNLPDSTWTFVDSKSTPVNSSLKSSIIDFAISDRNGNYITDSILSQKIVFIYSIPYPEKLSKEDFSAMSGLYNSLTAKGVHNYALFGSSFADIDSIAARYNIPFEIFHTDIKTLISMNRSNGGMVYFNEGVVTGKWSRTDFAKKMSGVPNKELNKIITEDPELFAAQGLISEQLFSEIAAIAILLLIVIMRYICRFAYTHKYIKEDVAKESQNVIGAELIKNRIKDMTCKVEWKKDLKKLNTLGFRIVADWYAAPSSVEELEELISTEDFKSIDKMVTGSGSNILFKGDYNGLLIHPDMKEIKITGDDENTVLLRVGAGVDWDDLVAYAVDRGWGGLENLSLIPGCVGAAPVQNIGAYGSEAKDTIVKVEFVELAGGAVKSLKGDQCKFGYRDSIFKNELKGKVAITFVTFSLSKVPVVNSSYADLTRALESIAQPTIKDVRNIVIDIRRTKLPDPLVVGNVGSFFKNPVISEELALSIQKDNPSLKIFPAAKGFCKVPAAWLIDSCGFKGKRFGNVGVHENQPLVLLAYEGAKGEELLDLAHEIQKAVKERFNIEIEPEVNIV